jgi:hypothetical protein
VGDGSPLAATLIVRRGSRGGSTSPSVVTAGEGAPSEQRALHVLRRWPSHGSKGGPPSSDICLGVARPVASTLGLRVWRSGRPVDLGTHGGVCGLVTEGRHLVDLGKKVIDRPAPCEIGGTQHMNRMTQVDGW